MSRAGAHVRLLAGDAGHLVLVLLRAGLDDGAAGGDVVYDGPVDPLQVRLRWLAVPRLTQDGARHLRVALQA